MKTANLFLAPETPPTQQFFAVLSVMPLNSDSSSSPVVTSTSLHPKLEPKLKPKPKSKLKPKPKLKPKLKPKHKPKHKPKAQEPARRRTPVMAP